MWIVLLLSANGNKVSSLSGFEFALPEGQEKILKSQEYDGKKVWLGVWPEDISAGTLQEDAYPYSQVETKVVVSELLDPETMMFLRKNDIEFVSRAKASDFREPGNKIVVTMNLNKAHFFNKIQMSVFLRNNKQFGCRNILLLLVNYDKSVLDIREGMKC